MKIKEAIEFVNWATDVFYVKDPTKKANIVFLTQAKAVIALLKRGEKFEKMWNRFYKEWGEFPIELHDIAEFMEEIKDRHFPKEGDINEIKKERP